MSSAKHILVVDDDRRLRELLVDYLTKNAFDVTAVGNADSLFRVLERRIVDLIVLDVMLPGEDGLAACRRLRTNRDTPVIMLTAKGDDVDRIVGLELGADDYLAKPFNPRELLARIKSVLKRAGVPVPTETVEGVREFRFDGWALDLTTRILCSPQDERVSLTGSEYRLLLVLLLHANRVVTRNRLSELMRGRDVDPLDRSIDVRVRALRQLLREPAREPRIVRTVYGEGYFIGVPVERVPIT